MLAARISPEAVEIVKLVTKPEGVVYLDRIADLAKVGNIGAIRVKLADNEDNQDPSRVALVPGADRIEETRYAPARKMLLAALATAGAR